MPRIHYVGLSGQARVAAFNTYLHTALANGRTVKKPAPVPKPPKVRKPKAPAKQCRRIPRRKRRTTSDPFSRLKHRERKKIHSLKKRPTVLSNKPVPNQRGHVHQFDINGSRETCACGYSNIIELL